MSMLHHRERIQDEISQGKEYICQSLSEVIAGELVVILFNGVIDSITSC